MRFGKTRSGKLIDYYLDKAGYEKLKAEVETVNSPAETLDSLALFVAFQRDQLQVLIFDSDQKAWLNDFTEFSNLHLHKNDLYESCMKEANLRNAFDLLHHGRWLAGSSKYTK